MKFKSSSAATKIGILFLVVAVLCVALAVFYIAAGGESWVRDLALMLFCAVLWTVCGIIVLKTAKKLKEKESKKVKISAFNYAKVRKKK